MIYLLLNVVFSSTFVLIIKWVQVRKRGDIITIGALNYIIAALAALPELLSSQSSQFEINAALTGGSMGAIYFIAFFFVIYCVKWIGASASTVVSVLSILLPITVAAFLWDEQPAVSQIAGIALALIALSLIGRKEGRQTQAFDQPAWLVTTTIVIFFFLCGFSRLAQDTFKHVSIPEQRPTFLLIAFMVAATPSLILLAVRGNRISKLDLAMGTFLGLANILQTHFILKALEQFEGFIVFPIASAGSILLTTLVATRILHEKLTGISLIGIAIAVVALFLLY